MTQQNHWIATADADDTADTKQKGTHTTNTEDTQTAPLETELKHNRHKDTRNRLSAGIIYAFNEIH